MLFFSDRQAVGPRRVGWSWATDAPAPLAWDKHAPTALDLGESPAGEIDQHFFRDPDDGRTYLLWKTDDNSPAGGSALVTRLWAQEIALGEVTVRPERNPRPALCGARS